jgi:hypothetical protein
VTFDWHDHHEHNSALNRLYELKEIRPDFKCTLFAVPALGSPDFWASHPDWVELAVHGWDHHSVYECADWRYAKMDRLLAEPIIRLYFVEGFCAPGWQISDDCYRVLLDRGWWVADQHLEDGRRPAGLRTYFYEDGNWHGHVQNVCGNGLQETWGEVCEKVRNAPSFEFASACVSSHPDHLRAKASAR